MNRLAAAIVFTSQGVPFFLNGEEFARTKPIPGTNKVSENSYNLTLEINGIRYEWTKEQEALQEYYKGLIAFRKARFGGLALFFEFPGVPFAFLEFIVGRAHIIAILASASDALAFGIIADLS